MTPKSKKVTKRKPHSEETKKKIRESCLKRVFSKALKKKIALATLKVTGKPVLCVETGKEFASISAAARRYQVAPIQISRVCRGERYTVHGKTFKFLRKKKK